MLKLMNHQNEFLLIEVDEYFHLNQSIFQNLPNVTMNNIHEDQSKSIQILSYF